MSSRSDKDHGLVRIKEHMPYFGKGVDELIAAIRKIFTSNKYPQKIVLEAGAKHIYVEKLVHPDEAKESEAVNPANQTVHDGIRNAKLEEYEMDGGELTPFQQLFEMYSMVQGEGLEICHIAIGNKSKFQKWLGVRIPQSNMNLLGTQMTATGEIPEDVFIVCGGPSKNSDPHEIRYAVKGAL
jgi:hypothetical protein